MNDRFRFRAFYHNPYEEDDCDNKKMFYDAESTYDYLNGVPASSFGGIIDSDFWTVEQCTGLKDNNGKIIYDGDFLDYKGEVCLVFWSEPTACFGVMLQDSGYTDYAGDIKLSDLYSIDAEIIGNIHENPELLKESK